MWVVYRVDNYKVMAELDSQQEAYDRWKIIFKRSMKDINSEIVAFDIAPVTGMTSKQWTMWKLLKKRS